MDQESKELDLSQWVIVHETPLLGWLGLPSSGSGDTGWLEDVDCGHAVKFSQVLVLQTLVVPGPGGALNMVSVVCAPQGLTVPPSLTLVCRGITRVSALSKGDQQELTRKVEACLKQLLVQRGAQAGIVLGGGRP